MATRRPHKLTIVIPTRERCETLAATLRSCVADDYENLEVLVSDNASIDGTADVVRAVKDPRVRYVNTGKRVSMSDNWEIALSQVHEGYVTVIGDDDALIPGSLSDVASILTHTSTKALAWAKAVYYWPDHALSSMRNTIMLPMRSALHERNSEQMLRQVAAFRRHYNELPCLYNSFVQVDAIKSITSCSQGFFHSRIPDVYSGIAISHILESFFYYEKPVTLNGISGRSNGSTHFFGNSDERTELLRFEEESTIPFHASLPFAPSEPILVTESILQAEDHIPSHRRKAITVDYGELMDSCLRDAVRYRLPQEQWSCVVDAVQRIAANQGESFTPSRMPDAAPVSIQPEFGVDLLHRRLVLDGQDFGINDVYGAALTCKFALNLMSARRVSPVGVLFTAIEVVRQRLPILRRLMQVSSQHYGRQAGASRSPVPSS